jgi:anaerobic selenocysteine-containing dehydrogenase
VGAGGLQTPGDRSDYPTSGEQHVTGRRVVFVSGADLAERGLADEDAVDLVSVWSDGERRAPAFRVVEYPTPAGSAAAYFPEANVLVPLDSTAAVSNTPTSKSVIVRLERTASPAE